MKIMLSFCISTFFLHTNTLAQVYQFTSDKEGKVKLHSTSIQYVKKNILITIDVNKKKIKLVPAQIKEFNIISVDSTLIDNEVEKCLNTSV